MPLTIPAIDSRNYQNLLDEAVARIPVHTPEWTNFNKSDPGITLIEVFAFLTESLLYRANQIPERSRKKFLALLGVPLQPASSAKGLVAFSNEAASTETITLTRDVEVLGGSTPFRTTRGLDVVPVEAQVYCKSRLSVEQEQSLAPLYDQLYAAYRSNGLKELALYQTTALGETPIDTANTVDGAIWIALMVRRSAFGTRAEEQEQARAAARKALAGRTISVGWVPIPPLDRRDLVPGTAANPRPKATLIFQLPVGGTLPTGTDVVRNAQYRTLDARMQGDLLVEPGVAEVTLPAIDQLVLWDNLDPLEAGTRDFPPAIDDAEQDARIISWLKVTPGVQTSSVVQVNMRVLWAGINTVPITQRVSIRNELLAAGTGEPDQRAKLANSSILADSVRLTVDSVLWEQVDDLASADPEVPTPDPRKPPGTPAKASTRSRVYTLDAEAGVISFGDGLRGARPPADATVLVNYDYSLGAAGNVGARAINSAPALPPGIKVENPVQTWGGAESESVIDGEKQVARYVQHRDRAVSVADFEVIVLRTPGVNVARVDVLPAFHPDIAGVAPGAVTLMVIPQQDPQFPAAPRPTNYFLDAVAGWLSPRRLVTTEVFLKGPSYKRIWISIGIDVVAGMTIAEVTDAVKVAIYDFLSPLPSVDSGMNSSLDAFSIQYSTRQKGWPRQRAVSDLELAAVASRVSGVQAIVGVLLAGPEGGAVNRVEMTRLELPEIAGIAVVEGDPLPLGSLQGLPLTSAVSATDTSVCVSSSVATVSGTASSGPDDGTYPKKVPVPVTAQECV